MNALPTKVKIVDIWYTVTYVDKPSDVDHDGRSSLAGQIDFFKRSIRIHDGGRDHYDIMQTLWHEIIHGVAERLRIQDNNLWTDEDAIDLLAIGVNCAMQEMEK